MPVSKIGCQILAASYEATGKTLELIEDVRSKLKSASLLKTAIRYGKDVIDNIGDELISTIGSVASRAAKSVFGSLSNMSSNVIELVLKKLLEILLAFPTAIFSLVAIPHRVAKQSASDEQRYLIRAYSNINNVISIVFRWSKGKSGDEYYNQIKESLPYIKTALILFAKLLKGLSGFEDESTWNDEKNSRFDERAYRGIKTNLAIAINITKPKSELSRKLKLDKMFENERDRIYKEKEKKINAEYQKKMRKEGENYQYQLEKYVYTDSKDLIKRTEAASYEYQLIIKHDAKVDALDFWRKEKLESANIEAESEAHSKLRTITRSLYDLGTRFSKDMEILYSELQEFLKNIGRAYVRYQESQLLCNNMYHSKELITSLIQMCIAILRKDGNEAGDLLTKGIEKSESLTEVAEEDFESVLEKFENSGQDISSSELAISVVAGHGTLIAADNVLNSIVTQSLIDLINADDYLSRDNDDYNKFIEDLASIPDWDNKTGVWSVSIDDSAISPYINVIAEATEMLTKVPVLALSNREKDKRRVSVLIRSATNSIKKLIHHNSLVKTVLNSYQPYMASQAGDLTRILASVGLLKEFAMTMSILSVANKLGSDIKGIFNRDEVNFKNCYRDYREMFDNEYIIKAAAHEKVMTMDPNITDNSRNTHTEETELDIKALKLELKNIDINTIINDEDLLKMEDPVV